VDADAAARAVSVRVALVIGNVAYGEGKLLNAVNDAKDMAMALRSWTAPRIAGLPIARKGTPLSATRP
jgi:hypothetical protein